MLTRLKTEAILTSADTSLIAQPSANRAHISLRRKQYWFRFKKYYKASPKLRAFILYAGFSGFILGGSLLFFAIERSTTPPYSLDPRMYGSYESCIGNKPYWGSLFYALSAASTIAFGQVRVCTNACRVITLFYSIIGIPFIVYVLADLGGRLSYILVMLYAFCRKQCIRLYKWLRKRFRKPKEPGPFDHLRYIDDSDITTLSGVKMSPKNAFYERYVRMIPFNLRGWDSDRSEQHSLLDVPSIAADQPSHSDNDHLLLHNPEKQEKADMNDIKAIPAHSDDVPVETVVKFSADTTESENSVISIIEVEEKEDEEEEVDFSDFTPDLPLSICFLLIIGLIISITAHIHSFEHTSYGYSFYYALLFFVMQDYEVRDLKNTIPTFALLISGLAIISTTINAIIYNIQNLTNRVKAKLPMEIRRRKEEMAAAGFPDAVIDPEEVLREMLEKEGSFLTRSAMPKSTIENLGTFCESTVQKVEQKMEEERQAKEPMPEPCQHDVGISAAPVSKTSSTNTRHIELINQITQYLLESMDQESNTEIKTFEENETQVEDGKSYTDQSCQWLASVTDKPTNTDAIPQQDNSTQLNDLRSYAEKAAQCIIDIKNANTNTDIIQTFDALVQCVAEFMSEGTNTTPPELKDANILIKPDTVDARIECRAETADVHTIALPETEDKASEATVQEIRQALGPKPVKATIGSRTKETASNEIGKVSQAKVAQSALRRWKRPPNPPDDKS